jgi:hypothetical protein
MQPARDQEEVAMSNISLRPARPSVATSLGTFHVLIGTFIVINGLWGLTLYFTGVGLLGEPHGTRVDVDVAIAAIPGQRLVSILEACLEIALGGLLVLAGVAVLQLWRSGRTLSLLYAVLSILNYLFALGWLHFTYPATSTAIEEVLGVDSRLMQFILAFRRLYVGGALLWALGMAYPIVVLSMVLSSALPAGRAKAAPPTSSVLHSGHAEQDDEAPP